VAIDLIGFGIVVPILGRYAERFGASGLEVGLLFASFSLAQLVFSPILGRLSDRIGRKPVILVSLLGTAVGSFITGAAGSLWLLFVGRIIDGASGASVAVAQGAVTDVASPEQRPRLLGLLGAAFGVGFVIGPALGGLASLGGVHLPFFVAGTLALINAVVAWFRLPETRPKAERSRNVHNEDVRNDHVHNELDLMSSTTPDRNMAAAGVRLWGLAFVGLMAIIAFSGFEATFSLLAGQRFDLTEAGIAAVFVGVGIVLVAVQTSVIQPVVSILGSRGGLQLGLGLNVLGLMVLWQAETWLLLIAALLLLTVGQGLVSPNLSTLVAEGVPVDRRGEALGFQQGANALGRVLGPALAGLLYDRVTIGSPYVVGSVLCAAALVVVFRRVEPRPTATVSDSP
jgi:MFS transporter, DHA1 family, tetracycline resistance protein